MKAGRQTMNRAISRVVFGLASIGLLPAGVLAGREAAPLAPSADAAKVDQALDWSRFRLLSVQEGDRYKTVESFAREAFAVMYGAEHFPGLSPNASLLEWLFNRQAYRRIPVVKIKEKGLRVHFSAHMADESRNRILATGRMTPAEIDDPTVQTRMKELEPKFDTRTAMGRVRHAEAVCKHLDRMARVVPGASADLKAPWLSPVDLQSNAAIYFMNKDQMDMKALEQLARRFGAPLDATRPETAVAVYGAWVQLGEAWQSRDIQATQAALDRLVDLLPSLAQPGVYPRESQRSAEQRYYAMGKFAFGYWFYLIGAVFSVAALVTRWRTPWAVALLFCLAGLGVHAYGLALRWYILDRIPVANMFEAITFCAWAAVIIGILVELVFRSNVLLVASNVTGFFALIVANFLLPGGGTITSIMGILDDLMLRIHTVLIITSYGLVFLAGVVATFYLFGYYLLRAPRRSIETSIILAFSGAALLFATKFQGLGLYAMRAAGDVDISMDPRARATFGFIALGAIVIGLAASLLHRLTAPAVITLSLGTMLVTASLAILPHWAAAYLGWTLAITGFVWALSTMVGMAALARRPATVLMPELAGAGGIGRMRMAASAAALERPILAGGAPGDERSSEALPAWLLNFDWMHLIMLNMVFVLLFVGIILGAVWADYSWGRPWGWDPKEVFAMNTWIIYAILIHIRFVVKQRGLWTAWLSVAGTAMMAFNWWVVNFFIVGLHSYA